MIHFLLSVQYDLGRLTDRLLKSNQFPKISTTSETHTHTHTARFTCPSPVTWLTGRKIITHTDKQINVHMETNTRKQTEYNAALLDFRHLSRCGPQTPNRSTYQNSQTQTHCCTLTLTAGSSVCFSELYATMLYCHPRMKATAENKVRFYSRASTQFTCFDARLAKSPQILLM